MADINTIKNLRNNHAGYSINKISKLLKIDWRTAKKYADGDFLPTEKTKAYTGMMYDEGWGEIVVSWLTEDARLTKKKRRNSTNIYEALVELGFPGSYRTVCAFTQEYRRTHVNEHVDEGYDRLEHPPAEAQLDFGTMEVEQDGKFKDLKVLVLSFPYSNAAFAYALPGENQECLFEGMKALFTQAGGVPKKIRIDNMSTAVKQTKNRFEEAQLTDGWQQFANHFRFETQVCQPRSGHEKGNVENKVGYVRYNFFTNSPTMNNFDSLNQKLFIQMNTDRERVHYEKGVTIEELWQVENIELLALPDEEYPVFKETPLKANKYNEVVIDKTKIHVLCAKNYPVIHAILTWDQYKVIDSKGAILAEGYRPYMEKGTPIPWTDIIVEWKRKLNVVQYSRYWKYLPGRVQWFLQTTDLKLRQERIITLQSLLVTMTMKEIDERFFELLSTDTERSEYDVDWQKYDSLTPPKEAV